MRPQRVSIFLPSLTGGGAERAITIIANGLATHGADVNLVLANASGPYLKLVGPQIRIVDLAALSQPRALPGLLRHLRATRPDALLSAMTHANVVAALAHRLARSRARLVLSERVHLTSLFTDYRNLRMWGTRALMRLCYPWADQVIAVSRDVAEDVLRHAPIPPDRVVTVYNPIVDEDLVQQAEAPPSHPWLLARQDPVVLAAGRLVAQKDFPTLIRAFAQLRRHRAARLLILGEGELRHELLTLARDLGVADDVALPGFEANPFSAMRAAQLFVLSSRFEGLPGVLIQAMACGTPVVSTDCPGGPREVLEDGRWGALVPVGDPDALEFAMAAALDEPSPPNVRARAAAFTAERAVDGYARALGVA